LLVRSNLFDTLLFNTVTGNCTAVLYSFTKEQTLTNFSIQVQPPMHGKEQEKRPTTDWDIPLLFSPAATSPDEFDSALF